MPRSWDGQPLVCPGGTHIAGILPRCTRPLGSPPVLGDPERAVLDRVRKIRLSCHCHGCSRREAAAVDLALDMAGGLPPRQQVFTGLLLLRLAQAGGHGGSHRRGWWQRLQDRRLDSFVDQLARAADELTADRS